MTVTGPAEQATLLEALDILNALSSKVFDIDRRLEFLMTQDQAIAAEAGQILADEAATTQSLQQIQAAFAAVLAEAQNNAPLSATTLAQVQQAAAQADALAAAASAAGSADAAAAPAPAAAATPEGGSAAAPSA